jgi:tetratricopeptide (TPR) repeat protein
MTRLAVIAFLSSLVLHLCGAEEPPKKPPYQRMLRGEDEKQVAEWQKRIAALEEAGKREEALKVALEVLALRRRVQGTDHWQVRDAERKAVDLRRAFTPQQRRQLAEAQRLYGEVGKLYDQGKYPQAVPLARKALDILRKVLGDEHPHTAACLNELALLYESQGRYADAQPYYWAAFILLGDPQ